jgi:hypothetical protein
VPAGENVIDGDGAGSTVGFGLRRWQTYGKGDTGPAEECWSWPEAGRPPTLSSSKSYDEADATLSGFEGVEDHRRHT